MYNIIINYKLGNYVKDDYGKIYQITRIAIDIVFSQELMKDVAHINLELVDARNPWGNFYIIPAQNLKKAYDDEVNEYVYNNKLAINGGGVQVKPPGNRSAEGVKHDKKVQSSKTESNQTAIIERERTADDILDEVNDYKSLTKMFGDENGKYKKNIDKLSKEFEELLTKEQDEGVDNT